MCYTGEGISLRVYVAVIPLTISNTSLGLVFTFNDKFNHNRYFVNVNY